MPRPPKLTTRRHAVVSAADGMMTMAPITFRDFRIKINGKFTFPQSMMYEYPENGMKWYYLENKYYTL